MLFERPKIVVYEEPAWLLYHELRALQSLLRLLPTTEAALTRDGELCLRFVTRRLREVLRIAAWRFNPRHVAEGDRRDVAQLREEVSIARVGSRCFASMKKKNEALSLEDFLGADNWCLYSLMLELHKHPSVYRP